MTHHAVSRDPRPLREVAMQKAIIEYIAWTKCPGVVVYHCPNGEARSAATGAKLKAMGVLAGVADLTVIQPGGFVSFLELKVGKNPLSEDQQAFRDAMAICGLPYETARTFEEAITILESWHAVKRSPSRVAA